MNRIVLSFVVLAGFGASASCGARQNGSWALLFGPHHPPRDALSLHGYACSLRRYMLLYTGTQASERSVPVDITVYLPDEIGQRAKAAKLNLSGLLREAVIEELDRREAVAKTLEAPETFEVKLERMDGTRYTGLITGEMVLSTGVRGSQSIEVYFTDDERVILYDADKLQYRVLDDPEVESAIRNLAEDDDEYIDVMESLGRPARIRL